MGMTITRQHVVGAAKVVGVGATAVGGWAAGMYAGNWPHRAIHRAVEGRPEPGKDPHDPAHYRQDAADGDQAGILGAAQLAASLGVVGGSLALGHRTGHPGAGKLGALAGAGAFVGVAWELVAGLVEADAAHPGQHVDFPAFL